MGVVGAVQAAAAQPRGRGACPFSVCVCVLFCSCRSLPKALPCKPILTCCALHPPTLCSYPALYKAMDALVVPTHGEGWGRPQLEAMAMGLPVIRWVLVVCSWSVGHSSPWWGVGSCPIWGFASGLQGGGARPEGSPLTRAHTRLGRCF